MANSVPTVAYVNWTAPAVPASAGRKGFKAELDGLRERMRILGFGYDEIAAELSRRYRVRPREAYRLAHGWSLGHAAERYNALAAEEDPCGNAGMTGPHLCEYEKWPHSTRKPSVYVLGMLSEMYETDVLSLLDLADHESLPQRDRLVLLHGPRPGVPAPSRENLMRDDQPPRNPGMARDSFTVNQDDLALALPFIPRRLVIEITGPDETGTGGMKQ